MTGRRHFVLTGDIQLSGVIVRESERSSIPETGVMGREAAAYAMPRLRGA
jgi:hypothetical protein